MACDECQAIGTTTCLFSLTMNQFGWRLLLQPGHISIPFQLLTNRVEETAKIMLLTMVGFEE